MLSFYGHPDSGHAHKVALALRLAAIEHRFSWIDIWAPVADRPADFLAASRWREVPCVVIEGRALIQSGAILLALAERFDALGGRAHYRGLSEWVLWEANRIGMAIPQLIWAREFPEQVNPGAQDWLRDRLAEDIERLAQALSRAPYLLGESISLADLCVFGYVDRHPQAGIAVPAAITHWLARIRAHPRYLGAEAIMAQTD